MTTSDEPAAPDYLGHRQRLKERFLKGGADALPDYELLEILLFLAKPRVDTKPLAKDLLARFGNFAGVISASPTELMRVVGVKENTVTALKVIEAAARRLAHGAVIERSVLSSWDKVVSYCRVEMAHLTREQFHLLFLDKKNGLIAAETQQSGTVDHTPVYPREVTRRALELDASAVIMVHNHPSGDPTPSRADIEMTRQVEKALKAVGITLHDHLVIGRAGESSFRSLGLI